MTVDDAYDYLADRMVYLEKLEEGSKGGGRQIKLIRERLSKEAEALRIVLSLIRKLPR